MLKLNKKSRTAKAQAPKAELQKLKLEKQHHQVAFKRGKSRLTVMEQAHSPHVIELLVYALRVFCLSCLGSCAFRPQGTSRSS